MINIFRILNVVTILLLLGCSTKPKVHEAVVPANATSSTSSHLKSEQTDAKQQFALGSKYYHGKGVAQNYTEAAKWYRLAADQGNEGAQYMLGVMYESGEGVAQSFTEAAKWLRLAANQGDAGAQNNLGLMYNHGEGVAQNYTEAVKWFRLAAEQGTKEAQVSLGWYYMNGNKNLTKESVDYGQAVYWNQRAADNGDAEGFNNLGWLYENGLGVKRNLAKAAELYQIAVIKGNKKKNIEEAKSRLAALQSKKKTSNVIPLKAKIQNNDPLNIRD